MSYDHEPTIGVLGGGQLGRMLGLEARRMGYRLVQWTGGEQSGAERFADVTIIEPFDDPAALTRFTELVDCASVEFENIPKELISQVAAVIPTFPSADAIAICQDRECEKSFLRDHEIPTAQFEIVENAEELESALAVVTGDVIIKTAQFGYDGKGQLAVPVAGRKSSQEIWSEFGGGRAIVEQKIDLKAELSVMVVRGQDGETITYDPAENEHRHHILHTSIVPARISESLLDQAQEIAIKVVQNLDYVGVIGVEFFLNQAGELLVNEMAPRPHNSGHHTLDACETSQFEQQLRAVVGLPLGSTALTKPVVMLNLLGDLWPAPRQAPNWSQVLSIPGARLHLYGKREAKAKRKMGHMTFLAESADLALDKADQAFESLSNS